jgi:hypothetical protein
LWYEPHVRKGNERNYTVMGLVTHDSYIYVKTIFLSWSVGTQNQTDITYKFYFKCSVRLQQSAMYRVRALRFAMETNYMCLPYLRVLFVMFFDGE